MSKSRLLLTFFMSFTALSTGFTTVKRQSCSGVSPQWMNRRYRSAQRKPYAIMFFQVDDTALEFQEEDAPLSNNFEKIRSMVAFLWIRSAAALMKASQTARVQSLNDQPGESTTKTTGARERSEVITTDDVKTDNSITKKVISEGDEVKMLDQNEMDIELIQDESLNVVPELKSRNESGDNESMERTVGSMNEGDAVSDIERPSTMHEKEGDRVIALKDEFLDPLPDAISLDFGRPLEVVATSVPPLRKTPITTARSK